MAKTELIRVSKPNKQLLEELKIIETESFNSVIGRILQTKFEDILELNQETKNQLEKRMKNISGGKVFSNKELLERIRNKREILDDKNKL